jgi:hypothetical protein
MTQIDIFLDGAASSKWGASLLAGTTVVCEDGLEVAAKRTGI